MVTVLHEEKDVISGRLSIHGLVAVVLLLALAPGSTVNGQTSRAQNWSDSAYSVRRIEPVFNPLPASLEILRLENGMQVLLMNNPAQPMVGIYTQVRVGSAYEDFRTSGMSHMLEHLLFNGTDKYTQQELYDLADRHGAYNNANTADFFTNYMLVLPARSLETGLEIQSQMLFHSVIPPDKFEKEKGIILGELVSARDRPGHFAEETLREVIFAGSNRAMPTLGTRSTIEHLTRDDVYDFYKSHYVPNNMIMTLAGRFDREAALALIEQYFGAIQPGTLPVAELRPVDFLEHTQTVVRRGGGDRVLALAFTAPSYGAADFFAFKVLVELLSAPGSGILTLALEDLDAAVRPELSVWWERAAGFARLVLQFDLPAAAEPDLYWRLIQDACVAALDAGISNEDVLEIVKMEETDTLLQREQLRHTGIYAAEPIVLGGIDFYVSYLDRLRGVEAEEVALALQTYLIDTPSLAILIEPNPGAKADAGEAAGMQLPPGMQVPPAMLEAMRKAGMTPAAPAGEVQSTAEDAAGSPADLASGAPLQIDRTTLDSGAVLVSQTNEVSPLMAVHLTVRHRAVVDDENPGALNLIHQLLTSGIGGCEQTCLAHRLRQLGAVVKLVDNPNIPMDDYYTNGRFSFIRVEVTAENGPALLELLVEMTQHASFSAADFRREQQQLISLLEDRQESARVVANQLLAEILYGSHPLSRPAEGTVASLQQLDYDQLRTIYRRAFAPQNLIFSIVSPYAHADLVSQLEELLPGRGSPTDALPALPVTGEAQRITASLGGEMTAIRKGALFALAAADAKALEIVVAILSDRLAMDLRESRGLSYSVGASVESHEANSAFTAWINPPRERAGEGEEALTQFITDFDPATITAEELDKIRNAKVGRWMMRLLSSMSQAYYLAMAELDGNVARYGQMLEGYDRLTLGELQRVWDSYLAGQPLVTVVVD